MRGLKSRLARFKNKDEKGKHKADEARSRPDLRERQDFVNHFVTIASGGKR